MTQAGANGEDDAPEDGWADEGRARPAASRAALALLASAIAHAAWAATEARLLSLTGRGAPSGGRADGGGRSAQPRARAPWVWHLA